MLTVHHLNNSRSQRVLWLLEELGVPYEIQRYEREASGLAPASLIAVHPLGKSPVVTEGAVTVAESGAILEYLLEAHGQGRLQPGADAEARRRYTYWMHFAEGSAMPPLVMKLIFNRIRSAPMPFFAKPIARGIADKVIESYIEPNLRRQLDFMEAELGRSAWFAGDDLTAADIQMSFPVEAAAARGGLGSKYPRLAAWLAKVHARPAYQRALERGGPFELG